MTAGNEPSTGVAEPPARAQGDRAPVRLRESLIPGLGHVLRGHGRRAWRILLFLAAWVAVVVFRFETIVRAARERSAEDIIALAFLVALPVALAFAAHRHLRWVVSPRPRTGLGAWALAAREFVKKPRGVWGLTLLGVLYMVAFLCPILAPYDPNRTPRDTAVNKYRAPGDVVTVFGHRTRREVYCLDWRLEGDAVVLYRGRDFPERRVPLDQLSEPRGGWSRQPAHARTIEIAGREVPVRRELHVLGTDANGRDLLSRIIYGSRISLSIGFAAMAVAVTIGVVFGSVAGFFGGFVDGAIMRFVDVLLAFPRLLLLLLIITVYQGAGIFAIVMILGATGWMGVARLVRAQFLQLKELDYTTAARAIGVARTRIMFRHLLPNAIAPVIVAATLRVGDTILVEAALSFLGLGIKPPTATWGNIVNDGSDVLATAWWIATLPGLAIVVTVICFNLVGDTLRDVLDPRLRI